MSAVAARALSVAHLLELGTTQGGKPSAGMLSLKKAGAVAGVSEGVMGQVKLLLTRGSPELLDAVRDGVVPLPANRADLERLELIIREDAQDFTGVYIASNDLMPGVVKVGMTTRGASQRVKELNYGPGVFGAWDLAGFFRCGDQVTAERLVHDLLVPFRVRGEFFRVDVDWVLDLVGELDLDRLTVAEAA